MGNLNKPDPCFGPDVANLPRGFWRATTNIPERPRDDCFEPGPPTLFLADWDPHISGSLGELDPIGIMPTAQCAVLEWNGSAWIKISDVNPVAAVGDGGRFGIVRSFSRFGNHIWFSMGSGALLRSLDGGQTWEPNYVPAWTSVDQPSYIDRDASGRLWSVREEISTIFDNPPIYVSRDGQGDNWELVTTLPEGSYLSDGAFWGPTHTISCHPTDPDTVVIGYNRPEFLNERRLYITQDGGNSWRDVLLPGQGIQGNHALEGFFAAGDQGFDSQGRFYIAWQVEEYAIDTDIEDFCEEQYWIVYSDDLETFTLTEPFPEIQTCSFGFLIQLYIYGDVIGWAAAYDDEDELGDPVLFSMAGISHNRGQSFTELHRWIDVIGQEDAMPGYPQDLFYNHSAGELWVFHSMFDDANNQGNLNNLEESKSQLQTKLSSSGGKSSEHSTLAGISGIPIPRSKYASVTRHWPPI